MKPSAAQLLADPIPWLAADALWAVKVRRAYGEPKYVQIAGGSSHGLYNADGLHRSNIALFCEGEFDALLVQQEAGGLVSPVTLGSATARLTTRWYGELVGHRTILVAYDRDEAVRRGTEPQAVATFQIVAPVTEPRHHRLLPERWRHICLDRERSGVIMGRKSVPVTADTLGKETASQRMKAREMFNRVMIVAELLSKSEMQPARTDPSQKTQN